MSFRLILVLFILNLCVVPSNSWGSWERVKLQDVKEITLYYDKITTSRRSSPVPQLKCVGGTAGCLKFTPKVVQCFNRGFMEHDVLWECKAEMDKRFQFGDIQLSCEGFDYPDDPYILRGSCGLEYTIDFADAEIKPKSYSFFSWFVAVAVIVLLIYAAAQLLHPYQVHIQPVPLTAPPPRQPGVPVHSNAAHPNPRVDSGPGFWTGAALGYLSGRTTNTTCRRCERGDNRPVNRVNYESTEPRQTETRSGVTGTVRRSPTVSTTASSHQLQRSGFGGTSRREFTGDSLKRNEREEGENTNSTQFGGTTRR